MHRGAQGFGLCVSSGYRGRRHHLHHHEHLGALPHALRRKLLATVQGHGRAALHLAQQAHAVGRHVQLELGHDGVLEVAHVRPVRNHHLGILSQLLAGRLGEDVKLKGGQE